MINWTILLIASLVPMVLGFIWYHPKVFGNAWMKAIGMSPDTMKSGNMAKIFGLCFLFSFLVSFALQSIVIHQFHVYSIFANDTTPEGKAFVKDFMDKYGDRFRTFKHGMLHGFLLAIFVVLPVIGTHALFEKRNGKYIWINTGYWIVSMMLMGGIICAFA